MINTHDEAAMIVELFENVLDENDITVPGPDDDERNPENTARLYGMTYYELLDAVERRLIMLINRATVRERFESYVFSGNV